MILKSVDRDSELSSKTPGPECLPLFYSILRETLPRAISGTGPYLEVQWAERFSLLYRSLDQVLMFHMSSGARNVRGVVHLQNLGVHFVI
jgi:hypothetical protein